MENYGPYSNLKFIHHSNRIRMIDSGYQLGPVNVQLVISNACNLNCSFCYYRNGLFPPAQSDFCNVRNAMMPAYKVYELIDDCKDMGVKSITVTGGGEPTVHPQFEDIFERIIGSGLDLGLNTNGVNTTKRMLELIRFPEFQWVKVSLDAGSAETYAKIKSVPPCTFKKVVEAIEGFVWYKRKYNSKMTVGVGMIVVLENYHEIIQLAEFLKRCGVDSFRVRSVAGTALKEFYGDKTHEISVLCKQAQQLSDEKFTVENLFVDDLKAVQHPHRCLYQYLHTFIGADMQVNTCCLYSFGEVGRKGSIAKQGFKKFWFSPEHQDYLRHFNPAKCPTCDYVAKNDLLEYIVKKNPVNINFL